MAGYNLGSAYVQVVPSLKGLKKGVEQPLEKSGDRAGKSFGSKVMGGLTKVAKVGAVAAGAAAGVALVGGFRSAVQQDTGERVLAGLYGNAEKAASTLSGLKKVASNSPINYQGYQDAAASLAYAGVEGDNAIGILENVGKAITASGGDTSNMDSATDAVLKMVNAGKVQLDTLQQLSNAGVPILSGLAEHLGVPIEKVNEMASAGKIGLEDVLAVMENATGDTFQSMLKAGEAASKSFGNQWLMAKDNVMTAIGGTLVPLLDKMAPAIRPISDALVAGVNALPPIIERVSSGLGGVWDILTKGDFTGSIFGLEEDSPIVDFLFTVRETAIDVGKSLGSIDFGSIWGNVAAVLSPIVEGFKALGPVLLEVWQNLSPLGMVFDILAPTLPQIGSAIGELAGTLAGVLQSALSAVLPAIGELLGALGPIWANLMATVVPAVLGIANAVASAVEPIVQAVGPLLSSVISALVPVIGMIVDTAGPLVAMLADALAPILVKVGEIVGGLVRALAPLVTSLIGMVSAVLKPLLAVLSTLISGALKVLAPILNGILWVVGKLVPIIGFFAKVLGAVATVAGKILGGALNLLNNILEGMVPFLTGVFVGAWNGIKVAISAVGGWITGTLAPGLQSAWSGIAAGALWLYNSAILPAWSGIKAAVQVVGDWITGTLWPAIQTAWDAIGAVAMWLWQSVIQPAWTGIRIAIAVVVTAVLVYIDLLKFYFQNVIAPVAMWLWTNVMVPVWNGIKAAIGAVAGWIVNTAWPLIKQAWDAIAGAAMWLWNSVLKPAWAGIQAAISAVVSWLVAAAWPIIQRVIDWIGRYFAALKLSLEIIWNAIKGAISAVVSWFQNTAWPLISKVIDWLKMSFEGWKLIAQTVWSAIKSAIKAVSDWLTGTLWPVIKGVIDKLKSGFTSMKDGIKAAWDAVKEKAIQPVVGWLTGTVKPKIDKLTDNIKSGFDTMKEGVLKAWDKIKEGLKSPINGIIDIYTKHIKGNFDSVAEKLGLDTRLPTMTGFATGGYTGPGSKYTPAGIVHADEYVIRKESQNDLRRNAPGFLDSLNKFGAKALGYAAGGLVKLRMPFAGSYPRGDGFGARGGKHDGIDWPMPSGAVLKAVAAGHVKHTRNAAAGNKLELQIGNGLVAGYHHLSSYIAKHGSSVGRGADVARVGSTGRSSGPHLHFSLKRDGKYVDPAPYLGAGGAAGSGGGGGWWNPFDGLWSKIKGKVSKAVGGGMVGDILTKTASNTIGWAKEWVTGKLADIGDWASDQVDSTVTGLKATRWTPTAIRALQMEGEYSRSNLSSLLRRMNQESGFDPRAINDWDSNAKRGTPSKGLMQVIDPTFRAYARPGYDKNIWDPLSNILASIRYARAAYGSPARGWNRPGGYADGGWTGPGSKNRPAGLVHADEFVVQKSSRRSIESAHPGFLDSLNRYGAAALAGKASLYAGDVGASAQGVRDGVTITGGQFGYSPEEIAQAIRRDQRKQAALRVPVRV